MYNNYLLIFVIRTIMVLIVTQGPMISLNNERTTHQVYPKGTNFEFDGQTLFFNS